MRLKEALALKNPLMIISSKSGDINLMMKILKKSPKVVVPTDATNSFRVFELKD